MKLSEVRRILDAEVLCREELLDTDVLSACGSDLMSDVLAFVKNQALLLTGQINPQVIRTAEMMDIKCVIFVRGKRPDDTVIDMGGEHGMVMMTTPYKMYESCGKLYAAGLVGEECQPDADVR